MDKTIKNIIIDYIMTAIIFIILETILVVISYYNPNSWLASHIIYRYWWAYDLGVILGLCIVASIKIAIYMYKVNHKKDNEEK